MTRKTVLRTDNIQAGLNKIIVFFYRPNLFRNTHSFENWVIFSVISHQVFLLAQDWSKHVT